MSILLRRCCAPQGDKICSVMLEKEKTQGRRPRHPGGVCPSAGAYGMRPYGVMGFYLIIYTYKKHPARQRGAAGGVARVLIYFRSDP